MRNLNLLLGEILLVLFAFLATFGVGYGIGYHHSKKTPSQRNETIVTGNAQTKTVTRIEYKEKTSTHNADLEMKIGKPDFSVKVNDEQVAFNKSADEKYIFDRNQISVEQTNKVEFVVKVQPIDLTKHFGIGIGFEQGVEMVLQAPIFPFLDGYLHGNDKNFGLGAMIRF